MQCPLCKIDLSPLDEESRTEHVNYCIGDRNKTQKFLQLTSPRIICPVCNKSFKTILSHFRMCAFKNDVPPHMLLEYWDNINGQMPDIEAKPFPRELLDDFILKCCQEGRMGEDVDFARALSISMAETEKPASKRGATSLIQLSQSHFASETIEDTAANPDSGGESTSQCKSESEPNEQQVETTKPKIKSPILLRPSTAIVNLMKANKSKASINSQAPDDEILGQKRPIKILSLKDFGQSVPSKRTQNCAKKYKLELTTRDESRMAVQLRVERELAASRDWRERRELKTYVTDPDVEMLGEIAIPKLWVLSAMDLEVTSNNGSDNAYILDEFKSYCRPIVTDVVNADEKLSYCSTTEDNCDDITDDLGTLSVNLTKLIDKEWMSDMFVKCGFKNFFTHQLIWFSRTHKNNRATMTVKDKPTVDLSDFSVDVVSVFLNYLYGATLRTNQAREMMNDLMSLAERLGCKSLSDMLMELQSDENYTQTQAFNKQNSTTNPADLPCSSSSN